MRLTFLSLTLAASFGLSSVALAQEPAPAAAPAAPAAPAEPAVPRDPAYNTGMKALDEGRWADAVSAFDKSANASPEASASALYWKAYSLEKLGRKEEAQATCEQLRSKHAKSSWNRECTMLRVQSGVQVKMMLNRGDMDRQLEESMKSANFMALDAKDLAEWSRDGNTVLYKTSKHPTNEDDIRLVALNSLMRQDPAKALPILRDLINSDKPIEVRKQALFVLSRSKQPEAQALLTQVATSSKDPELQHIAVESLSINHGADAGPTLVQIYRNSSDTSVKHAAINGLFMAHDATRLVDLARSEKDLNLKRDIVSQLALMKDPVATDYMLELLK